MDPVSLLMFIIVLFLIAHSNNDWFDDTGR
jgi:hypothetical protein